MLLTGHILILVLFLVVAPVYFWRQICKGRLPKKVPFCACDDDAFRHWRSSGTSPFLDFDQSSYDAKNETPAALFRSCVHPRVPIIEKIVRAKLFSLVKIAGNQSK